MRAAGQPIAYAAANCLSLLKYDRLGVRVKREVQGFDLGLLQATSSSRHEHQCGRAPSVVPHKFLHLPFVESPLIDSGQACRTMNGTS